MEVGVHEDVMVQADGELCFRLSDQCAEAGEVFLVLQHPGLVDRPGDDMVVPVLLNASRKAWHHSGFVLVSFVSPKVTFGDRCLLRPQLTIQRTVLDRFSDVVG